MVLDHNKTQSMEPAELEELMLLAEPAPERGLEKPLNARDAIRKVVDELGEAGNVNTAVTVAQSAGYVIVFGTLDHEPSIIHRNQLATQLKKPLLDENGDSIGGRAFTTIRPKEGPLRGTIKCLLHKEGPNRERYTAMGLTTCKKSNLRSQYDLEAHMRIGHPREWANINQEVSAAAIKKRVNFEEAILTKLVGDSPAPATQSATPGVGSDAAPVETPSTEGVVALVVPTMVKKTCDKCEFVAESTLAVGAASKLRGHVKKEHPDG